MMLVVFAGLCALPASADLKADEEQKPVLSNEQIQQLSLKRAEAVKRFLVAKSNDAGRLTIVGYGFGKLLAPDRPEDPSDRQVEIQDLGSAN